MTLLKPSSLLPWLKLAAPAWLGETIKAGLIKEFKTPEAVFSASAERLWSVKGWNAQRMSRFIRERHDFKPLCDPETLEKKGIRLVTFNDPEYPPLLRQIHDSPVILFAQGNVSPDDRPHLAIVGSRNGTQLGFDVARQFARDLSRAGFVIVSGLALGVDTYAHLGALDANGKTVAVLGCGVDVVYPAGNRKIREQILGTGTLFSEYPPKTVARPWHFPIRNRIIAGMCVGTLVVEATAQSGSLITARLAGQQDREVFAIPGSIRSAVSQGTLALINDGAQMVTSPEDIISHFSHFLPLPPEREEELMSDLTREEEGLLSTLADNPIHVDKLLGDGRWNRDQLFSLLLTLELRDFVVKYPGNFFQAKIKPPAGRANK